MRTRLVFHYRAKAFAFAFVQIIIIITSRCCNHHKRPSIQQHTYIHSTVTTTTCESHTTEAAITLSLSLSKDSSLATTDKQHYFCSKHSYPLSIIHSV